MILRDEATSRQIAAAAPGGSTWLAANAGSGKTRVLTDRVARLLLEDVSPTSILCLTYTKAAASEMQNRLFRRLGAWAMLDDRSLDAALLQLGIDAPLDADLRSRARRLFARAIETPGGLRIQTIHSFCAAVLRRFPMEAGISPGFVELDDRAQRLLQQEVLDRLADADPDGIVAELARLHTGADIGRLLQEILTHRTLVPEVPDREALLAAFGLPAGAQASDAVGQVFLGDEQRVIASIAPTLKAGSQSDVRLINALERLDLARPGLAALVALENLLLFGADAKEPFAAKTRSLPTVDTARVLGDAVRPLHALMRRVEAARPLRCGLATVDRTLALQRFAALFLGEYSARKAARGYMDFDDLVLRTRDLLSDRSLAQWVLYRLDGGIDHILVDEAQDTSPVQWQVIERLAQEFAATEQAADDKARTLFVVGDKKQSIYSFMGADLRTFDLMRDHFRSRMTAAGARFTELPMEHSFRSSAAVLGLVDHVFPEALKPALGGAIRHVAFHAGMAGRVDLWPAVPKSDAPPQREWFDPVDLESPADAEVVLAESIAGWIRDSCAAGVRLPASGDRPARAMTPGDVLILVRKRSAVFAEVIRACKAARLPVAGADRLRLGGELAVRDLSALLSFLATPEDDLSLATVLRSPLCGWSEDALFRLANPRKGYLWRELQQVASEHPRTVAFFEDLRDQADFLRPYDLLERVLIRHDGRRKLIARLGAEAEDGIDSLLSQALAQERIEVPSLTGFLAWLVQDDVEVKRRLDGQGGTIRVMTIHGAKGLESPIVILPDTALGRAKSDQGLLPMQGTLVWPPLKEDWPPSVVAARAARADLREEEDLRLMYVALTRAESWLVVCAAGETRASTGKGPAPPRLGWHAVIEAGMNAAAAAGLTQSGIATPTGWGQRLSHGAWPDHGPAEIPSADGAPAVHDWALRPAPDRPRPAVPVRASGLAGEKVVVVPGLADAPVDELAAGIATADRRTDAMALGTALHLLLERLPQADPAARPSLAAALLDGGLDPAAQAMVLQTATRLLENPALREVFAPGTRSEIAISATLPELGGRRLHGIIDRLILSPGRVLAVDYKTNIAVPGTPEQMPPGILAQMGAYAAALGQIYPDRVVATAILWTASGSLMHLPPDIVRQALASATIA